MSAFFLTENKAATDCAEYKAQSKIENRQGDHLVDKQLDLIQKARAVRASDIHLDFNGAVWLRCSGHMSKFFDGSREDVRRLAEPILRQSGFVELSVEEVAAAVKDFSFSDGSGRVRGHFYYANHAVQLALRFLPEKPPALSSLGLPQAAYGALHLKNGLVFVTGPAGSGKSTTIASLLQEISAERNVHIMTFESPIEYRIEEMGGPVHQCEIACGGEALADALIGALRADPDVIMIGEVRDAVELQAALTLAETGHLVFTTLHTPTAIEAVTRAVDLFPENRQAHVRTQLSELLRMVIGQRLLPHRSEEGMVLAAEVLTVNPAVARQIRENEGHLLRHNQEYSDNNGMHTLDISLQNLLDHGEISEAVAWHEVQDRERFRYNRQGGRYD